MVKRKAEFSIDIVPNCEGIVVADSVATDTSGLEPNATGREPTGVKAPSQPTLGHVGSLPIPVEEGEADDIHPFWALLAAASYQVW